LTDINHFGLRAQALLHQSDGENKGPCKWPRRRAGERSIEHVATYHVDLPKSTITAFAGSADVGKTFAGIP
jgi:hypothetical protein